MGAGSGHPSYLEVPVQHEEWVQEVDINLTFEVPVQHQEWVQEVVIHLTLRSLSSMRSGWRKWSSILPWGPCPAWGVGAGSGHQSYLKVPEWVQEVVIHLTFEVPVQHEEWVEEVVIHLTLRSLSQYEEWVQEVVIHLTFEVPVQHQEWVQDLTLRSSIFFEVSSSILPWGVGAGRISIRSCRILLWGPCPAWGVGARILPWGPCPASGVGAGSYFEGVGAGSYFEVLVQHQEWVQDLTLMSLSSIRSGCRILPWGPCPASGVGAGSDHPSGWAWWPGGGWRAAPPRWPECPLSARHWSGWTRRSSPDPSPNKILTISLKVQTHGNQIRAHQGVNNVTLVCWRNGTLSRTASKGNNSCHKDWIST